MTLSKRFAALAALGSLALTSGLSAQVIPGINTKAGGMVAPKGKLIAAIRYVSLKKNHMYDGTHEVDNREDLDARMHVTMLALRYGLADNMDIRLVVPIKQVKAGAHLGLYGVGIDNNGVGDLVLMGRYRFYNDNGYQIAVGAGVKLPTGSTTHDLKKAPPFAQGVHAPLPTQPGTGKAEYKGELGLSKLFDPTLRLDAHLMYTYRPKAKNDYDFGNEFDFDIGLVKALNDKFNIGLEYNFSYNSATNMGNDTTPALRAHLPFKSLSGSVGYLTPEIQFLPFGKPKLFVGAGMSFLVHQNLKEYQPVAKRKLFLRLGYMF